jgi:phosphohistidine phosphatase SixA
MKNTVSLRRGCATLAAFILLPLTVLAVEAPAAATKFVEIPATAAILKQLRQGGFSLYLRHGITDNTRADRMPAVDLNDCSTQRPLTEGGRLLATSVGDAIRKARIPISEIRSSPLCRAKETTAAAFPGQPFTIDNNLMYTANMTDAQKAPIIANTRRLLAKAAAPGSNHLQVAHAPNLMDLIGYFPKEGTLVIFRPQGDDRFEYVGSIPPGRWPELLH